MVSFLNRDKFTQIREATGVEFENLVFFRDENYYFVLTPKISSLVQKGVLHHGQGHPSMLLTSENVNREKLRELGREIADFCSLPSTSNYVQVKGEDDIQLFDFSTKTSCCQQVKLIPPPSDVLGANHLFVGVVGDALIEPFWPMGTGTNRALQRFFFFLLSSVLDTDSFLTTPSTFSSHLFLFFEKIVQWILLGLEKFSQRLFHRKSSMIQQKTS